MHNEISLKALTVPKLKELLLKSNLIQSGKKDELIQRLLENPNSLLIDDELNSPTPSTSTSPTTAEPTTVVDASTTTIIASSEIIPVVSVPTPVVAVVESPVVAATEVVAEVELTAEEKQAKATAEEEKRKKRMERFGSISTPDVPSTTTSTPAVVDSATEALNKRAERFGLVKEVVVVSEKKESNLEKSLAALDKPLVDRKQKLPKIAAVVPAVVVVVAQEEKIVDPELANKIAAEEEKKRKRAARFGEEPSEKKAKVDA